MHPEDPNKPKDTRKKIDPTRVLHPEPEEPKRDKPDHWSISLSRDDEGLLGGGLTYMTDTKEPVVMHDLNGYIIVSKGERQMRINVSDDVWSIPTVDGEIVHTDMKASIRLVYGDEFHVNEIYVLTIGKYVSAELLVFRSTADFGDEIGNYRAMILGARCAGEYYLEKISISFRDHVVETDADQNEDIYSFQADFQTDLKRLYSELEHIVGRSRQEKILEDLRYMIREYSENMMKLIDLRLVLNKRSDMLEEGMNLVELETVSKKDMLNKPEIVLELDKS